MGEIKALFARGYICLKRNGIQYTFIKFLHKIFKRLEQKFDIDMKKSISSNCKDEDMSLRLLLGLKEEKLNIGFVVGSGFGDNLIFANYLNYFRKCFCFPSTTIHIYFENGYSLAHSIFEEGVICDKIFDGSPINSNIYDAFLWVNRYPKVIYKDSIKLKLLSARLLEYLEICEKFEKENSNVFSCAPFYDGILAVKSEYEGIKRIQQPDIYGFLGIQPTFLNRLFLKEDSKIYLNSLGIINKQFITVHRGSDIAYSKDVTKLWPVKRYNELLPLLHERYPNHIFVQIGVSKERCPEIEGIDIALVGKTTMEQVKVLLKYSQLHIDGEGGFIHLRQALTDNPAVVFFGPTSLPFFSYKNNINICGKGCWHPCEWITKDWLTCCPRGFSEPPCMLSITTEMVMQYIEQANV